MANPIHPLEFRLYRATAQIFVRFLSLLNASFVGFWLGLLKIETLHLIDQLYYERETIYRDADYNRSGFWLWEKQAIKRYFPGTGHLLVTSAGGGREVIALKQFGYEVDGYECSHTLVDFANLLLREQGLGDTMRWIPRDACPITNNYYDGAILGWSSYMLISGRARRIAFLKQLRSQLNPGAPILLSFFARSRNSFQFQLTTFIGNVVRRLLWRDKLEVGDTLAPNFVHYFTEQEICEELYAAGFELKFYCTQEYGHAVGIVSGSTLND